MLTLLRAGKPTVAFVLRLTAQSALVSAGIGLGGCTDELPTAPVERRTSAVPVPDVVTNRYIVRFRDDVSDPVALADQLVALHGGIPFHYYQFALKGFAVANLTPSALSAVRSHPQVVWVEEDRLEAPAQAPTSPQILPLDGGDYRHSSLWALDRVEERSAVFNGRFEFLNCGSGSHIYIIDTGIRGGHSEWGYERIGTSVTRLSFSWNASPTIDQHGHGTGVASAAAGRTYGIAKCATLHSVRISDDSLAYISDEIDGLDWVAGNYEPPAVANFSWGGHSFGVRDAIEGVIRAGVVVVKAAGNDDIDAYQKRGNRAQDLIVVGSSNRWDYRSEFSNYGSLITLFAPGSAVRLADNDYDTGWRFGDGTSFAAPYVAGVVATLLVQQFNATAARIRHLLRTTATEGVLHEIGPGSPNRLLYSYVDASVVPNPSYGSYPTAPVITGPDVVQPHTSCWWTVSGGSSNPVAYEWFVDEVLQSETGYILWYSPGASAFQIEVKVHDADGTIWSDYHYVTTSSTAPRCPDVY
jgi:subtilisin family serine protease